MIGQFIIVSIIVQRDDRYKIMVKENDDGGWSSNDVVLWLGMRQNRDTVK
jgi:hypothetical protein